jgi:hypothetical protein
MTLYTYQKAVAFWDIQDKKKKFFPKMMRILFQISHNATAIQKIDLLKIEKKKFLR